MNRYYIFFAFLLQTYISSPNPQIHLGEEIRNFEKNLSANLNLPSNGNKARYVPITSQEMLNNAILNDSAQGIVEAVSFGAKINIELGCRTPLILAVLLNKNVALETLLNLNANTNLVYAGEKLVFTAIKSGNIKATTLLVQKGANFSGTLHKPLQFHSQNIMSYILNRFDITSEGILTLLQKIVNHGFNLNSPDYLNSFWVSAIECSKGRNKEMISFFLKNGANPNQVIIWDNQAWTPLLYAIDNFNIEAAKLLLEAGCNPNQTGNPWAKGKQTPLEYAISKGYCPKMIELLLEYGAQ